MLYFCAADASDTYGRWRTSDLWYDDAANEATVTPGSLMYECGCSYPHYCIDDDKYSATHTTGSYGEWQWQYTWYDMAVAVYMPIMRSRICVYYPHWITH